MRNNLLTLCYFIFFPNLLYSQTTIIPLQISPSNIVTCEGSDSLILLVSGGIPIPFIYDEVLASNGCQRTTTYQPNNTLSVSCSNCKYEIGTGNYQNYIVIKIKPSKNSIVSLRFENRHTISGDASCGYPITESISIFEGTAPITVISKSKAPTVSATMSPFLEIVGADETVKLSGSGCATNERIVWSPLYGYSNDNGTLYIQNPYDCVEYKAKCINSTCPQFEEVWSKPIKATNYYKPINQSSGYSSYFTNQIQRKLNESRNKPEFAYRKQFACLHEKAAREYNLTGENGWGGGFVKHLFDEMSTQNPCNSSIEYNCSNPPLLVDLSCFDRVGSLHFENELRPSFLNYKVNNEEDITKWTNQHEQFLTHAVDVCFDELYYHDNIGDSFWRWFSKIYVKDKARRLRTEAQTLIRLGLIYKTPQLNDPNKAFVLSNIFPNVQPKSELYSEDLYNKSDLKITIDSTFFLKVGQAYSIKTLCNTNGIIEDLTSSTTGTIYKLNVDSTIATITPNGDLIIKATNEPLVNDRFPLYIFAQNGTKIGIGQFSIFDDDTDSDFLNDTFENTIGLNPNSSNLQDLDEDVDGLLDIFEAIYKSNPNLKDSDNDGYNDEIELLKNTNLRDLNNFPLPIQSIKSGLWNDGSSWSCNCIPSQNDFVIIKSGHLIELNPLMGIQQCLKIETELGAIFNCFGTLKTTLK